MRSSCRTGILLGCILALAALLRAAYLFELAAQPDFAAPRFDAGYHDYWARGLVTGDWTPPPLRPSPEIQTTPFFRPPGYPYFLAGLYAITGGSYAGARAIQAALGVLSCFLAFLLGSKLFGQRAGLFYAALMAVYWSFAYFEGELLEPVLLVFLGLALFLLATRWLETGRRPVLFAAGLVAGLYALVRPNILLFIPVAVAWVWFTTPRSARRIPGFVNAGVFLAGTALAIGPATIRNAVAGHDLVLISANSGVNLYIGNNEQADGFSASGPEVGPWTCFEYPEVVARLSREEGRPLRYSEASRVFARKGIRYALAHPRRTLALAARKALLFWGPYEVGNNKEDEVERVRSRLLRRLPLRFPHVVALCVAGLLLLALDARGTDALPARSRAMSVFVLLFVATFFASYVPYFVAGRYRVPVVPGLLLFAACGLDGVVQAVRQNRPRRLAAWFLAASAALVLASTNFAGYRPDVANYHFLRGSACLSSGKMEQAVAELRASLATRPDDVAARADLAAALIELGRFAEAERECAEALRLRPDDPQSRYNMGLAIYRQGRFAEATPHLRAVVLARPDHGRAYYYLGSALANQNLLDEAADVLARAVAFAPEDIRARLNLAFALAELGRTDEAIRQFEEATALAPQARAIIEKVQPSPGPRQAGSAAIYYTRVLWQDPGSAAARHQLASALLAAGRAEAALPHGEAVVKRDPSNAEYRETLDAARAAVRTPPARD